MSRFVVAALVALLASACGPAVHVYVSADEPDELVEAVATAVDDWNDEIGVELLAVRVSDTPRAGFVDLGSVVVMSTPGRIPGHGLSVNGATDCYGPVSRVRVRRDACWAGSGRPCTPGELAAIVAHEIGHAFGLAHTNDPANLMTDSTVAESWSLTRQQRRRVRAVAGIDAVL